MRNKMAFCGRALGLIGDFSGSSDFFETATGGSIEPASRRFDSRRPRRLTLFGSTCGLSTAWLPSCRRDGSPTRRSGRPLGRLPKAARRARRRDRRESTDRRPSLKSRADGHSRGKSGTPRRCVPANVTLARRLRSVDAPCSTPS